MSFVNLYVTAYIFARDRSLFIRGFWRQTTGREKPLKPKRRFSRRPGSGRDGGRLIIRSSYFHLNGKLVSSIEMGSSHRRTRIDADLARGGWWGGGGGGFTPTPTRQPGQVTAVSASVCCRARGILRCHSFVLPFFQFLLIRYKYNMSKSSNVIHSIEYWKNKTNAMFHRRIGHNFQIPL